MGADDSFTIDELAQAAEMTPRNVRAYRTKGLLPPPIRHGRTSRYHASHLDRLRRIKELRDAGLPLRMIIEAAQRGDDLAPGGPLSRLSAIFADDTVDAAQPASEIADLMRRLAGDGLTRTTLLTMLLHSARSARMLAAELSDLLHADLLPAHQHPPKAVPHQGVPHQAIPQSVLAATAALAVILTRETFAQFPAQTHWAHRVRATDHE